MHRNELLQYLEYYRMRYPEESGLVSRFTSFINEHENCFERSLQEGHITCSAWLVDLSGERVLLTHHKKLNTWVQLGGHADGDSDVQRVALREAQEESGITELELIADDIFDIDIHVIPEYESTPEHLHYDIRFAFKVTSTEEFTISDESHDLAWVPISEITSHSNEQSMIRMSTKWIFKDQFDRV